MKELLHDEDVRMEGIAIGEKRVIEIRKGMGKKQGYLPSCELIANG